MDIQETQNINSRKTSTVQSTQTFLKLRCFRRVQKCRILVNSKLRDAQHKYSVNFVKQCETSKQKWNFVKKKFGNHKTRY